MELANGGGGENAGRKGSLAAYGAENLAGLKVGLGFSQSVALSNRAKFFVVAVDCALYF